jgi:hypothetical protein
VKQSILEHAAVAVAIQLRSAGILETRSFPSRVERLFQAISNLVLDEGRKYIRENETITVGPVRVLGVEVHELVEQNVGHRGHTHRGTGVTGVSLRGGINLIAKCQSNFSECTHGSSI